MGDIVLSYNERTGRIEERRVSQIYTNRVDHKLTVRYANGQNITTTKEHPFYVQEGGWRKAQSLRQGQHSATARTLRAGRMLAGFLISLASFSPANASLPENGPEIAGITIQNEQQTVHNFEVEGTHTYFVGEDGVLVHNESGMDTSWVVGMPNLEIQISSLIHRIGLSDYEHAQANNRAIETMAKELKISVAEAEQRFNKGRASAMAMQIAWSGGEAYGTGLMSGVFRQFLPLLFLRGAGDAGERRSATERNDGTRGTEAAHHC